jgi:hypothetical protein
MSGKDICRSTSLVITLLAAKYSTIIILISRSFYAMSLKVPKCEIFDRSDFRNFYTIQPFWVGDFGAKL